MRRKLFTLAAGVSAVVCVGVSVLWVVGDLGWPHDDWMVGDRWHFGLETGNGELGIWDREVFEPRQSVRLTHLDLGMVVFDQRGDRMDRSRDLTIRWWVLMIATMPLPAWGILQLSASARTGRRVAAGRCRACGYDLRATPDRCPECGRRAEDTVKG